MIAVMKMKKDFRQGLAETLSIPAESVSDLPVVCVRGNRSVCIENHRGIVGYSEDCVQIAVKRGSVFVFGQGLQIACMSRHSLELRGDIQRMEWEG